MFPSHYVTARTADILARVPSLAGYGAEIAGRAMLVRRTVPVPFECVGARLPLGIRVGRVPRPWHARRRGAARGASRRALALDPPLFSPATKAESGHDENVTIARMAEALGRELTARLRDASFAVYRAGRDHAASRGIIIADTKFEFGTAADGTLLLIDEVMTPDSSRFWPADRYAPGRSQPSFDKQPLRDYLAGLKDRRAAGTARRRRRRCPRRWSRPPAAATSRRSA